jgi:plastocyanin
MGKEELLRALLDDGPQAVTGQERERVFEEMQHLDLKPGDKVSWISGEYCDAKFPAVDEVAEVFRVFPIVTRAHDGSNHDADEHDFSILTKKNGTYYEYAFDSRRFKLVE